jgi:hypothetical protein
MKSRLLQRNGNDYLQFIPAGEDHPITLGVITKGNRDSHQRTVWTWNGDLEKPTLRPSIRTVYGNGKIKHYWLNDGICKILNDSTDGNAGKELPLEEFNENDW